MTQLLSVVVPCYNESAVIEETHKKLLLALTKICQIFDLNFEVIYVNDGSKDDTLERLQRMAVSEGSRDKVKVLSLSRNFGHQLALSAGIEFAAGDAVVAIDADLQDPPEVMAQMVEKWKAGADVVYGVRRKRLGESWFKLITAKMFYLTVRKLTRIDIPLDTGDFRLMSRQAVDVFVAMRERHRFIRGMIPWIGFKQESVSYNRHPRFAGETKYPLSKMMKLALDGITSFSNAPLQTAFVVGTLTALGALAYAAFILIYALVSGFPVEGWSSIMVVILFLGAVQLMSVGILGEYIGRIYDEVKQRPLVIIDKEKSVL